MKQACAAGANANLRIDGFPILHAIAIRGLPDVVDALVACGADVNARDQSGMTALMYLAFLANGDAQGKVMDNLIGVGADIDAKLPGGRTALDMAAQFLNGDSVRRLVAAGASATSPESRKWVQDALSQSAGRTDL